MTGEPLPPRMVEVLAALADEDPAFAAEMTQRYLEADGTTRADILSFFESGGPKMIQNANERLSPKTGYEEGNKDGDDEDIDTEPDDGGD